MTNYWKTPAPLVLAMAMVAAFGCAGDTASRPLPLSALPAVRDLDALNAKSSSSFATTTADVSQPLLSNPLDGASGQTWTFLPQSDAHSWALFRLSAPPAGNPELVLQLLGSDRLWTVVADYQSNRWVRPQQLGNTMTQLDLRSVTDPVSDAGFIYCAVILPAGRGGIDDRLTYLGLRYDDQTAPQVHYVASPADGGDDANPGTEAQPWATLQHAADTVQPGEGVCVLPGDYVGFMLQTSGLPGEPIVFAAQPGVRIVDSIKNALPSHDGTFDGINLENWSGPPSISYVTVEGFTINGDDFPVRPRTGIRAVGSDTSFAHHITLLNNTCLNCQKWGILDGHVDDALYEGNECAGSVEEHGIYHSNSGDRATIRRNVLHGNNACGLHMNGDLSAGGDGIISDCTIEKNIVYGNAPNTPGGSAINCDGVQDSFFRNNLLFDNHASGISFYQIDAAAPASGNLVTNNTIYMASNARWAMNIQNGSFGATLRNNILLNANAGRGSIDISADSLPGFTSDFNITADRFSLDGNFVTLAEWQAQTFQDASSATATAGELFYDPAGILVEDYLLKPGSPARDAGGVQNAPVVDLRGAPRPRPVGGDFDIGCFEME
jgi:hypothetical protein